MRYGWSLQGQDWSICELALGDAKWKKVTLEAQRADDVPKDISGVYVICAIGSPPKKNRFLGKLYNAVYVGKSINLRGRFRDHVRGYGEVTAAKLAFARLDFWYCRSSISELSTIEQALISALGPSANRVNAVQATIGQPISAGGKLHLSQRGGTG